MSEQLQQNTCPVCGMEVDAETAAGSANYDGKTYYFCSEGCADKFRQDPSQYVQG